MTMSVLHPHKADTLTAQNIVDSYRSAYYAANSRAGDCRHSHGRWFLVNGVERERGWLLVEVERLRQETISKVVDDNADSAKNRIFRLIRRLKRL